VAAAKWDKIEKHHFWEESHTFNSGATITEVRVERRKFQYLYPEDGGYALMEPGSCTINLSSRRKKWWIMVSS